MFGCWEVGRFGGIGVSTSSTSFIGYGWGRFVPYSRSVTHPWNIPFEPPQYRNWDRQGDEVGIKDVEPGRNGGIGFTFDFSLYFYQFPACCILFQIGITSHSWADVLFINDAIAKSIRENSEHVL